MVNAVTCIATLPVTRATIQKLDELLFAHRRQIGTRPGRRALGCFDQAVVFVRWMLGLAKVAALAIDNAIGVSTAYRYLQTALAVVAARAPGLHQALEATEALGYPSVAVDGTVIATDRSRAAGPTSGVDSRWSGKHHHHSRNIQINTAPDGAPAWASPVRPAREHATTALHVHPGLLDELGAWKDSGRTVRADLGYEGERETVRPPIRGKRNAVRSIGALTYNALRTALRAAAERGNALLKITCAALRHVTISPGAITAAALVVLHLEHHRTV